MDRFETTWVRYIVESTPTATDGELDFKTVLLNDVRRGVAEIELNTPIKWTPKCLVLAENGRTISAAKVAVGRGTFAWPQQRGETDSNGRFESSKPLFSQDGDAITISVRAPGFATDQKQVVVVHSDDEPPVPVFHLARGRIITGQIVDNEGAPIPSSSILVVDRDHQVPIQSWLVADSQGRFRVTGLPNEGRILLLAAATSHAYEPFSAKVDLAKLAYSAVAIRMKRAEYSALIETVAKSLTKPGYTIRGYTPDARGAPSEIILAHTRFRVDLNMASGWW